MAGDRQNPPAFDIPDLELPAPSVRQRALSPAGSAAPRQFVQDTPAASGPIELEPFASDARSGPRASLRAERSAQDYFGTGTFENDSGDDFQPGSLVTLELEGTRAAAPTASPEWPSGRSPDRSTLSIAEGEVRLGAGYPPPPSNPFLSPLYALQVTVRRRSLRETLARLDRELAAAEQQRDELLATMVNAMRPALENEPRVAELLAAARQLGDITGERGRLLHALSEQYQSALAETEARRAQQQSVLGERQAEQRASAAELHATDESYRRAEARQKRLQIEVRSAIDVARQKAQAAGLPPGTARPEEVAKIHDLQHKAAELEPELLKLKAARDQAHSADVAAQSAVAAVERELQRLTHEQRSLDRQYGLQIDQRAAGLGQAEGELRSALAEAGRALLAMRGGVAVDPTTLSAIAAADAEVTRLTRETELYLRALDACDRAAVQRGFTVAALACGGVLLMFVALMFSVC
jgi:hypothetical protein